jgi:hypothetical protein
MLGHLQGRAVQQRSVELSRRNPARGGLRLPRSATRRRLHLRGDRMELSLTGLLQPGSGQRTVTARAPPERDLGNTPVGRFPRLRVVEKLMKWSALLSIFGLLAVGGPACSSKSGDAKDGGTAGTQMTGTGGAAAGGRGGGGAGAGGAAGALGTAGRVGGAGTSGTGGGAGTGATAGATGGSGGIGGTAGRGGAGGAAGSSAGSGGSAGFTGGTGGTAGAGGGGTGGTGGGGAGGTGGGGTAGGGGAGGQGGAGGSGSALRVTHAEALPHSSLATLLVVVDRQDTAVVVGPSVQNASEDPGPTVTSIPLQGAPRKTTFSNAITPEAIGVDPSNNIWMAGQLYRPVNFGGPTLQPAYNGYYLAKLTSSGAHLFSTAILRVATPYLRNIVTDAQGNAYVVGGISDGNIPSKGSVFVTKFSPSGAELFNQQFPSQGSFAFAADLAIAPDGELIIVGTHNGSLQFGSTTLTLPTGSINGGFIAALDPATGAARRAYRFGGPDYDVGNSVEVLSDGTLRVAGLMSGPAAIGGMNVQGTAQGAPFVAELTQQGLANWVRFVGGDGIAFAADSNAADRTFAVGYVLGTVRETFVASVGQDAMLTVPFRTTIAYDSNGAWFAAADRHGGVWVTGDFKGTATFGANTINAVDQTAFGTFLIHLEP